MQLRLRWYLDDVLGTGGDMSEVLFLKYVDYLKGLNTLSKLDMVLLNKKGNAVADFIKCSKHKMVQKRRNDSRQKFISYIMTRFGTEPDFCGMEDLFLIENYFFYGIAITLSEESFFLCLGPFYVDEHLTHMIEADLPHYKSADILSAAILFQKIPGVAENQFSDYGLGDVSDSVLKKELDIREISHLNPTSQIRYNANREKIVRAAITNGDVQFLETYNNEFDYMPAEHMLIGEDMLKRAKHGILSANSVYCRAAEDGGASSVLVRNICAGYAEQINSAESIEQVIGIRKEVGLVYCRKVNEAKRENYSLHVRHCINWIEENITEELTLYKAAEHCGISYDYLSRLIKKDCGVSFSELVHRRRCQFASYYLQFGTEIGSVAEKCGYKSNSQFCHAFHKIYGVSPGKWQREHLS